MATVATRIQKRTRIPVDKIIWEAFQRNKTLKSTTISFDLIHDESQCHSSCHSSSYNMILSDDDLKKLLNIESLNDDDVAAAAAVAEDDTFSPFIEDVFNALDHSENENASSAAAPSSSDQSIFLRLMNDFPLPKEMKREKEKEKEKEENISRKKKVN